MNEKKDVHGVAAITPSDPSAVASLRPSDQGLQAPIAPAHYPLPWKVDSDCILDDNRRVVAIIMGEIGNPRIDTSNLIVRACNSHYELLEALKSLVGLAEMRGQLHEYTAALNDARAAIAKAEAK